MFSLYQYSGFIIISQNQQYKVPIESPFDSEFQLVFHQNLNFLCFKLFF